MRSVTLSRATLAATVAGAACLGTACSSSSPTGPIGIVYTFDSGADVATDNPPDVGTPILFDAGVDAKKTGDAGGSDAGHDSPMVTPGDSGVDATLDAQSDATSPADAPAAIDAGPPSICPSGTGSIAVLGGTSTLAFGLVSTNGVVPAPTSLLNSVSTVPALIPYATGFLGLFTQASTTYIESTLYTPGASAGWSTPSPVPAMTGSSSALGALTLSPLDAYAEVVYEGSDFHFYQGEYRNGAWLPADSLVGGTVTQDFGPSAPASAVVGATLYVAFDGNESGGTAGGLYVDSEMSTNAWVGAAGIGGAGVGIVPPTLIALTGGTADLMLVFEAFTTNDLYSVVHTPGAGAGTWSAPVQVDPTASSSVHVSVAPLKNGGAVLVYEGTNSFAYGSVYSPTASTPWTTPVALYPNSLPLASPPSVATGTCGVDAVAAITQSVGVELLNLTGTTWSQPYLLSGTAAMTYATVATAP